MQIPRRLLIIAGCAKSGTTALAHHLSTHADLVGGIEKEPRYFTRFSEKMWSGPASESFIKTICKNAMDYTGNFPTLRQNQWAIDASVDYIWCPDAPRLIKEFANYSDVKIICLVRDPVERAISEYNHTLRHGWESLTFSESLDVENERIHAGWHPLFYHVRRSTVLQDIKDYKSAFQSDLLILDYADLRHPAAVLNKIADFLDIPRFVNISISRENESLIPRNTLSRYLLNNQRIKNFARLTTPASLRNHISSKLRTDSRNVQTVSMGERQKVRELLADEIAGCIADPIIPTNNWHLALAKEG